MLSLLTNSVCVDHGWPGDVSRHIPTQVRQTRKLNTRHFVWRSGMIQHNISSMAVYTMIGSMMRAYIGVLLPFLISIDITCGAQCARGIDLVRNTTGHYVLWTSLETVCQVWLRSGGKEFITLITSPQFVESSIVYPSLVITCRGVYAGYCEETNGIAFRKIPDVQTITRPVLTTTTNILTTRRLSTVRVRSPFPPAVTSQTTTSPRESDFPTLLVVIAGCTLVVLILVTVLVVCIVKSRRTGKSGSAVTYEVDTERLHLDTSAGRRDGPDTGDDPVYDTADSPADTYAVVIKGNKSVNDNHTGVLGPENSDIYAVVQKPNKSSKINAEVDASNIYAEVKKPKRDEKDPMLTKKGKDTKSPNNTRTTNQDGLVYLDVQFSDSVDTSDSGQPLLIQYSQPEVEEPCEYAEVHHT